MYILNEGSRCRLINHEIVSCRLLAGIRSGLPKGMGGTFAVPSADITHARQCLASRGRQSVHLDGLSLKVMNEVINSRELSQSLDEG